MTSPGPPAASAARRPQPSPSVPSHPPPANPEYLRRPDAWSSRRGGLCVCLRESGRGCRSPRRIACHGAGTGSNGGMELMWKTTDEVSVGPFRWRWPVSLFLYEDGLPDRNPAEHRRGNKKKSQIRQEP